MAAKKVTHISVATNYNRREGGTWKSDPQWHRIILFDKMRDRLTNATIGDLVRITGRIGQTKRHRSTLRQVGNGNALAWWSYKQRNDGQMAPSLTHAEARSNDMELHGILTCSTKFLHRRVMSIFIKKNQLITELPSFVLGDDTYFAHFTLSSLRFYRLLPATLNR